MPLYAGSVSKERAAKLVKLLEDEHQFGTNYPVPSVPLSSDWFQANRYWQGPTWVNTNWLIIEGLENYGYRNHASALRESTIELIEKSGFYEYFNPIDGTKAGIASFSWTAALIIDMLKN
jgi:glycogen debranching enzyme